MGSCRARLVSPPQRPGDARKRHRSRTPGTPGCICARAVQSPFLQEQRRRVVMKKGRSTPAELWRGAQSRNNSGGLRSPAAAGFTSRLSSDCASAPDYARLTFADRPAHVPRTPSPASPCASFLVYPFRSFRTRSQKVSLRSLPVSLYSLLWCVSLERSTPVDGSSRCQTYLIDCETLWARRPPPLSLKPHPSRMRSSPVIHWSWSTLRRRWAPLQRVPLPPCPSKKRNASH